jgi:Xaa-Pro aminopeptidase
MITTRPLRYALGLICLLASQVMAQPVFRGSDIFPPEEFAARRAKLMEQIGDSVAIVLGTTEPPGEMPFRQNSQFFYLTGVVEPRASVMIDGRTKKTTLFLTPHSERQEKSMFGPGLNPGADPASLGVDAIVSAAEFTTALTAIRDDHRVIYTPFAAEVLGSQSQGDPTRHWKTNHDDPWDGRDSREATFIAKLKSFAPEAEIKDLDPIENQLRLIKSPREIAIIRQATNIAGLGIMEAMRDANPGMKEYELQADAEFVFKKHGAYGAAYFALVATGQNTYYTHYNRNTATLANGDLVQFDYAPDYKYYQSDVTRVFPANGKFTARQREGYEIYLKLYQALMSCIRPRQTAQEIIKAALPKMDTIMASYKFNDPKIKTAAENFVANYRKESTSAKALGHWVGMEVHDACPYDGSPLQPGEVFTIEPQMRFEEEHTGIRLEDMIVITENGYENLSSFVPIEVKDIENLMGKKGLSDGMLKVP